MDLNSQITDAQSRLDQIERELEALEAHKAAICGTMTDARRLIRVGEASTGDRWRDFAIVRDGNFTGEMVYPQIEAEMSQHVAELMLMVCRWVSHDGCTGFGGEGYYTSREEFSLGILNDSELSTNGASYSARLSFPTSQYAKWSASRRETELCEGELPENSWAVLLPERNHPFEMLLDEGRRRNPFDLSIHIGEREGLPVFKLELVFGNEEVDSWFAAREEAHVVYPNIRTELYAALGYSPGEPKLL